MASTFLVVEDDDVVRGLILEVLQREQKRVLTASSVEEAREVLLAHSHVYSLCLIIDVVLHDQSGIDFAQELLRDYPAFRVLLISGFTDDVLTHAEQQDRMGFLAKPFTHVQLLSAVNRLCGE